MREASLDELQFDGSDAPIVHVRGCDTVCTRMGVCHGHVRDSFNGHRIVKTPVIAQDAAVAVRGVLAEADVSDDEELGEITAKELDSLDDRSFWIIRRSA